MITLRIWGGLKKTGFSHEAPYEPPQRPEVYYDARSDAGADPPYLPDGGEGPHPPPPSGNLGAFQGLFGTRTGNMPIQSGYYATPFNQNLLVMPLYASAPYNILAEEGMYPDLPPPQPGLFQQIRREKVQLTRPVRLAQQWEQVLLV